MYVFHNYKILHLGLTSSLWPKNWLTGFFFLSNWKGLFPYWIMGSFHCQIISLCYFYFIRIYWDFLHSVIYKSSTSGKGSRSTLKAGNGLCIWNMCGRANLLCCLGLLYHCLFFLDYLIYLVLKEVSHSLWLLVNCFCLFCGFCFMKVPTIICCINIPNYCILCELKPWALWTFISVIINVLWPEFYLFWY